MGDKFYPDRFLKQVMPKSFYSQNLVDKDFDLKKNALKAINRARTITGRPIDTTVYNVLSQYEQKYKGLIAEGESSTQAFNDAVNGSALLRQRIEQAVVYDEIQNLKAQHTGEFYRWMPSSAANPDPEHQLLYGKIFRVGEGDKNGNMPGERYGCQCGIEWFDSGENERERILRSENPVLVEKAKRMFELAELGMQNTIKYALPYRKVKYLEAVYLRKKTKMVLKGVEHTLTPNDARHIYKGHSMNKQREIQRNQIPVTKEDFALIPYITKNPDNVIPGGISNRGFRVIRYFKKIGDRDYEYREEFLKKRRLVPKTFFIKK